MSKLFYLFSKLRNNALKNKSSFEFIIKTFHIICETHKIIALTFSHKNYGMQSVLAFDC
jgi:hypothetical protein